METPRLLTDDEIKYIIENSIIKTDFVSPAVEKQVIDNISLPLYYKLKTVLLKPSKIESLIKNIKRQYVQARQVQNSRVGFTTAEAVIQPLTQAALNAFHSSGGLNENLIQRLTQLLTATVQKNPYYILYVKDNKQHKIDDYMRDIKYIVLSDIIEMNEEFIIQVGDIIKDNKFPSWYKTFVDNFISDSIPFFGNFIYNQSSFYNKNMIRLTISGLELYKNRISISKLYKSLEDFRKNKKEFTFIISNLMVKKSTIQKIIRKNIYEIEIDEPYFYVDIFYAGEDSEETELLLNEFINESIHRIRLNGIDKINYVTKLEKNLLACFRFQDKTNSDENIWDINLNEQYIISNGINLDRVKELIKMCDLDIINIEDYDIKVRIKNIDQDIIKNVINLQVILKYLSKISENVETRKIITMIISNMKKVEPYFIYRENKDTVLERKLEELDIKYEYKNKKYFIKETKDVVKLNEIPKMYLLNDKLYAIDPNEYSFHIPKEKLFKRNITSQQIVNIFKEVNYNCKVINDNYYVMLDKDDLSELIKYNVGPIDIIKYKINKTENDYNDNITNTINNIVDKLKVQKYDLLLSIIDDLEIKNYDTILNKIEKFETTDEYLITSLKDIKILIKEDKDTQTLSQDIINYSKELIKNIKREQFNKIFNIRPIQKDNVYIKSRFNIIRLDVTQTKFDKMYDITERIRKEKEEESEKSKTFSEIMYKLPFIDKSLSYSSDVNDMIKYYGIDVGRNFIVLNMYNLISGNGDYINSRHITLLADFMFLSGSITKITSKSIIAQKSTMLEKLSTGSVRNNLQACMGTKDSVEGISSCIMLGKKSSEGVEPDERKRELEQLEKIIEEEELQEIDVELKTQFVETLTTNDIVRLIDTNIKEKVDGIETELKLPEIYQFEYIDITL